MSFEEFKKEVELSRPRMALGFLVPVVQELVDKVTELEAKLAEPCVCDCADRVKTPAKKAPAKAPAAKEEAVENTKD